MDYKFSNKINRLKPSAIREILKATADPNVISFAAGNPSEEAFPINAVQTISEQVLKEDPILALQYGISEGYAPLREILKNMLSKPLCTDYSNDDILIVSGAQQALDLAGKVFTNEGDVILCENPSFVGALNSFKANGAELAGVELESDGVNIEKLEKVISENKNVKAFYIIPNFQNPSGITTSLEKRKAVYDICAKNNIIIIEDNPYGDLRFSGDDVPPIKSFDKDGIVVYCGSFSKVLSPGIRVGHITAAKEIINRLVVAKQSSDVHTSMWPQLICYNFLAKYDFDEHLKKLRSIYRHKCELMLNKIDECFNPDFVHTVPEGGLFIWCTAPNNVDIMEFCQKTVQKNVAVVPGTAFLPYEDRETTHSFRLNFSTPSDSEIVKGIKLLGEVTKTI